MNYTAPLVQLTKNGYLGIRCSAFVFRLLREAINDPQRLPAFTLVGFVTPTSNIPTLLSNPPNLADGNVYRFQFDNKVE